MSGMHQPLCVMGRYTFNFRLKLWKREFPEEENRVLTIARLALTFHRILWVFFPFSSKSELLRPLLSEEKSKWCLSLFTTRKMPPSAPEPAPLLFTLPVNRYPQKAEKMSPQIAAHTCSLGEGQTLQSWAPVRPAHVRASTPFFKVTVVD